VRKTTTTCDHCQRDISETRGVTDYRLTVYVEKIPNTASVVYEVFIEPTLHRDMHFCGTACLIAWTDTIRPKERAV
jgi:hypothetical protein